MIAGFDESRGALLLALRGSGIRDIDVLRAIETVPREHFLPERLHHLGSRNVALPIACGQTMPAPLSVALMMEALAIKPDHRLLEIGTGSGYATALLAQLAREVVSFERFGTLAKLAGERLSALAIDAEVVVGDGLEFPAAFGLFDRVVVHAAIAAVPSSLAEALAEGGRIVAGVPAGSDGPATLAVFERDQTLGGFSCRRIAPMRLTAAAKGEARFL